MARIIDNLERNLTEADGNTPLQRFDKDENKKVILTLRRVLAEALAVFDMDDNPNQRGIKDPEKKITAWKLSVRLYDKIDIEVNDTELGFLKQGLLKLPYSNVVTGQVLDILDKARAADEGKAIENKKDADK